MKKIFLLLWIFSSFLFLSCETMQHPGQKPVSESVQKVPSPVQQPAVQNDDEYHRSVNDIEVTKET
ncbi:MAG TPA: hypothetical protein DCL73_07730, partial [Treponema sp.]|nr:hypothetical protein [Treponema sp.]